MKKPRKTRYIIIPIFLIGLAIMSWILSEIIVFFKSGATFETSSDYSTLLLDRSIPHAKWIEDGPDVISDPGTYQRSVILKQYLRAWQCLNQFMHNQDTMLLSDYFSEPLQRRFIHHQFDSNQMKIDQADLSHFLSLQVFSYDQQFVSFKDLGVRVVTTWDGDQNKKPLGKTVNTFDYDVVMTLDDGKWRIRHFVRNESDLLDVPIVDPNQGYVSTDQMGFKSQSKYFQIRGINYYPQHTPWFDFWPSFTDSIIDHDMGLVRSLELNTVRFFIPFELFGGKYVHDTMLDRMDTFIQIAGSHGLFVIPTLFDFPDGYGIDKYAQSEMHMERIMERFANSPEILAWDIKNEPDLDFDSHGKTEVLDWLEHMIQRARLNAPNHLITIGWSNASSTNNLIDAVDFVSFHYYDKPRDFPFILGQVDSLSAQHIPIVVSEFGMPSSRSFFWPGGGTENEQGRYYQELISIMDTMRNMHFLAWTLYDFPEIKGGIFKNRFWNSIAQKNFGLIRTDRTKKLASKVISGEENSEIKRSFQDIIHPFYITITIFSFIAIFAYQVLRRRILHY